MKSRGNVLALPLLNKTSKTNKNDKLFKIRRNTVSGVFW